MKANRIVVMTLFAVLLLMSCKTTKLSTQLNSDVQTIENRDVVEKQDGVKVVDVAELIEAENETTTKSERSEDLAVIETTTVWSKPDSTGKQYPEVTTTRETKLASNTTHASNNKQVTNHARDSTAAETLSTEQTDKSDLKSDSSVELNEKTKTKVKTPSLFTYVAILLAVGALVFVYFILRRYKIL